MRKLIQSITEGNSLDASSSESLFDSIFSGSVSPVELAAILVAMKMRRETSDELVGAARSMRRFAVDPGLEEGNLFDTCGTGGDHSNSFNISTSAALILAAMGVPVAKHGNRSVSSKSGSADFLEALGIPINLQGDAARAYFARHRFLFLFAPLHHPAMKHAMPVRQALGVRTIFNFLGPLTNPASPCRQMIGVFHPGVLPLYADAAASLGFERVLLYSSVSGMDEVSPLEPTVVIDVRGGAKERFTIDPAAMISRAEAESIPTHCSADQNARHFMETVSASAPTPLGKLLALNAALALHARDEATTIADNYRDALDAVVSGQVRRKVESMREEAA
ncbi:MAG: anthranilate phosphoribosyltransferase [Spirochaetes bacterium]|nr:MAG: anthranilate phosphoribosyltransferase [Spirochaetota bacterium]